MSFAPESQHALLSYAFSDAEHPAYVQIATIDKAGFPQVRTVHMHYIKDLDALVFSTHTKSSKWEHLKVTPKLSGCYVDDYRLVQFRWTSKTELVDPNSSKYMKLLDHMWLGMRVDVRQAYIQDNLGKPLTDALPEGTDVNKRTPTQSIVICRPIEWRLYNIHADDYTKGTSSLHQLKDNKWISKDVSILHGK